MLAERCIALCAAAIQGHELDGPPRCHGDATVQRRWWFANIPRWFYDNAFAWIDQPRDGRTHLLYPTMFLLTANDEVVHVVDVTCDTALCDAMNSPIA